MHVRGRERRWCGVFPQQQVTVITANLPVACVTNERKNTAVKRKATVPGRLPLYAQEIAQLWKILFIANPLLLIVTGQSVPFVQSYSVISQKNGVQSLRVP
jgi:hypothetical protein